MAQTAVFSEVDVAAVVDEATTEGRKLADYLFMDAANLDAAEGLTHPSTRQLGHNANVLFRRQWSHDIETSISDVRLVAIADALAALRVGSVDGGNEAYLANRNVDVEIFPRGFNIPVYLRQDKCDMGAAPSDYGRYEVIYNVHDGIIIMGFVKRPTGRAREDPPNAKPHLPNMEPFIEPCDVIGAMFRRLHTMSNPTSYEDRGALARATQMVYKAVNERSPVPMLPADSAGSWLPAALFVPGIMQTTIAMRMRQFLNYIVVYVNADYEAYAIVKSCVHDILQRMWDNREIFVIGHWSYYALLGSDMGQEVAWLLARRKSDGPYNLGSKCIQSITAFCARCPEGMTPEEVQRYHTAVLVFEVVETSDELRAKHANQGDVQA